ncbi:50S ribosomal protein L9 [Candidatus Pacearchaeota archaeon]|nr:MAG: 50S ribosomal protein L9 [Candidatus Pacearchaeota archaeon]
MKGKEKVILLKDIEGLGKEGEIVEVSSGFAYNYLVPRGEAMVATEKNLKIYKEKKKIEELKKNIALKKARKTAEKIKKIGVLEIPVKVGPEGKPFGSVSSIHILDALRKQGIEVDKGNILLEESIKELGEFDIPLKLHPEVEVNLKIRIKPKE